MRAFRSPRTASATVPLVFVAIVSLSGCYSRTTPSAKSSTSDSSMALDRQVLAHSRAPEGNKPRMVSWPDLERYYPEDALRDHINGIVRIAVTLDKAGRATDTHILSETPPNLGFGAAASTVAHLISYSNPTGHETSVTFNIKFRSPPHLSRLKKKLLRLR